MKIKIMLLNENHNRSFVRNLFKQYHFIKELNLTKKSSLTTIMEESVEIICVTFDDLLQYSQIL